MTGVSGVSRQPVTTINTDVAAEPVAKKGQDSKESQDLTISQGSSTPSAAPSGSIPVLAPPTAGLDMAALTAAFLALKVEINNEQQESALKEVQATGKEQKTQNDEIAKKMAESVEKMQKAETAGFWGKIFSWVAVALTVVVAVAASVATGGLAAGPCIAAAVAVTMLVLSETGAMDKLTELVAKGLEACGMSKDDAKKWSQWIMVGVGIAISLVTLGAGIASAFGTSASAAARASAQAATAAARTSLQLAAEAAQKIAQMVSAMVTIAQQTASVTGAVFSYEAGNIQADTADIKAYLAKLQQILEDESELLQSLVQDMSNAFSKALQIMSGQAEQQAETIQHMA